MEKNPIISIITPLYNAEQYVAETIECVLAQTYPYWEMLFVDDGSTDNSYNIVREYSSNDSRISLFKRDRAPKGPSVSRNIGINKSIGDYIIFLDADDLIVPTCLENRIKIMEKNPELDFSVFQMNTISTEKKLDGIPMTLYSENYLHSFISSKLPWTITCPIWRAGFFKFKLVGFNEELIRLEDPELHVRALTIENINYKIYTNSDYLDCFYRVFPKIIDLTINLKAYQQYFLVIYSLIIDREDKEFYWNALYNLYDKIISLYSVSPDLYLRKNINMVETINKSFYRKKVISGKLYRKTSFFLLYIKCGLYKLRIINNILLKAGFKRFFDFYVPSTNK